ncbi:Putative assembly protein OS=Afipia felis OX=1035 GN=NCTC12722_01357 PE=4 SV=1 [Afipia felis]
MLQTTLLGLAIAAIMALVAALAAPLFIDWNQYKPQFEAEASRVVGAPVRVEGALDARLLPAPILRLHKLSVGAPKDPTKLTADKLDVEFSLGSLLRGEWRATQLSLNGLSLDVGLDRHGRIVAPSKGEFNFGALAIDRLDLSGHVALHDEASGSDLRIEGLGFSGDVRALGGNLRGEGHVLLRGVRQPFRLALSRPGEGEPTRLRLDLDAAQAGAMASSLDGALTFKDRVPHFDGALTLAAAAKTPWRITARTALAPSGASFTQGDILYGAEATGVKLSGDGALSFRPMRLRVKVSANQLDLDRAAGESKTERSKSPADFLANGLAALPDLPWPSQVEATADRVTLAGQALSGLSVDLEGTPKAWAIARLAFSGPGDARLAVSGRMQGSQSSEPFLGSLDVKTGDAQGFADWAFGKLDAARGGRTPLHLAATMTRDKGRLVLDGMTLDLGGSRVTGRIVRVGQRIDATLQSPQLDLDALADTIYRVAAWRENSGFETHVSFDLAKATILGREVAPLQASLSSVATDQSRKRMFDLHVRRAALSPWLAPQQTVSGLSSRLVVSDGAFALESFSGKLGAASVQGSLSLSRRGERDITGDVATGVLDMQALTALMLGADGRAAADPLAQGLIGWRGSVTVKAEKAMLPGGMEAAAVSGTMRGDGASLSFDNVRGAIGGGAAALSAAVKRGASDTAIDVSFKLEDADAPALKYRGLQLPPGKASVRMTLATRGRSAAALRNALSGNGVLALREARLPALDAAAFDVAEKASDDPAAKNRMESTVAAALDRAPLVVASVDVPFVIRDSRVHADPTAFQSDAARATISGGYDIPEGQGDLRIGLKAMSGAMKDAPDIQIFLRGTADRIERDVDVAALSSWLSLRAIERETQRLDALEKQGAWPLKPPAPQTGAPAQSGTGLPPAEVKIPGTDPRRRAPVASAPRDRPASSPQLAPLPPPIDIKPAPGTLRPRRSSQPVTAY